MTYPLPHVFDLESLSEVHRRFTERLREGLEHDGLEIRALPAFVGPPPERLSGRALVLDTGGTNMRAALVCFEADGAAKIEGLVEQSLRTELERPLDRAGFFALHAALAERLAPPAGLPVGYCFSYPFEALPDGDARLLRWTKGLRIDGVEGSRVGRGLEEALADRGFAPGPVRVLNDTVAALLGGATRPNTNPARQIGLIVGTGTNMAGFFGPAQAKKLAAYTNAEMAVNLESGNFSPPGLSALDRQLDEEAEPRGAQRFEKAVSGLYLPALYALARPDERDWISSAGARGLAERAQAETESGTSLARTLLLRSAQLVATGLAAVGRVYGGTDPVHVLAEGSLFWSWPEYRAEVQATLGRLIPEIPFEIDRIEHANLVGAACAALAPSLGSVERPRN